MLLLALVIAAGTPGTPGTPTLTASTDTLRAGEGQSWNLPLSIHNPRGRGFYTDSLELVITPRDRSGRESPAFRQPLPALAKIIQAVSAGESGQFQVACTALIERGSLDVVLDGHDADGSRDRLVAHVVVDGGGLFDEVPLQVARLGDREVEWFLVPARDASLPAPGVLWVPGGEAPVRAALAAADRIAATGRAVLVVGTPGTGGSTGPADAGGAATQAAIEAGYRALLDSQFADPARIAVWGARDAATPALRFAAAHPEIRAVIAEDGRYDPWASHRATDEAQRRVFVAAAGSDSAAWKSRSALAMPPKLKAAVLLLQSGSDPAAPESAARALKPLLERSSHDVTVIIPEGTRRPSERESLRQVRSFLDRVFSR